MPGGRIIALDGLRGVAAITVMLRHSPPIGVPFEYGYLAVDLFFMLSGFVLARAYEPRFAVGLSFSDYFRQRLARLYPMLLIGSLLGLLVFNLGLSDFVPQDALDLWLAIGGQLLLVPLLSSYPTSFAFNGPQWSIAFELIANLLHRAIFRHLGLRFLVQLTGLCGLLTVVYALKLGGLNYGWRHGEFLLGVPRALFGFFLGVILCRTEGRWGQYIPALPFAVPAVLTALLAVGPLWSEGSAILRPLHDLALLLLAMPLIVMLGVRARPHALAGHLGTLSYPLYAIHLPVLTALHVAAVPVVLRYPVMALLPLAAWILGKWFDEPLSEARRARAAQLKFKTAPLAG